MTFVRFSKVVFCAITVLNVNQFCSGAVALVPAGGFSLVQALQGTACELNHEIGDAKLQFFCDGYLLSSYVDNLLSNIRADNLMLNFFNTDELEAFVKMYGSNWMSPDGRTILHKAVLSRNVAACLFSIRVGCPIITYDVVGRTPLDDTPNDTESDLFRTLARLYLENGFDKNKLLSIACCHTSVEYVELLTSQPYHIKITEEMVQKTALLYENSSGISERGFVRYLREKYSIKQQREQSKWCGIL